MVYVLLADGFEEIEAIEPIDIMRRAGIEVKTASITKNLEVTGAHNIKVIADMKITDVEPKDITLLMLPGGAGHELLDASNEVHYLINECVIRGIYIGAICAAPSILGKKMILNGKRATCFPGYEKYLYGANVTGDKVVVDGKFITAKGAGAAADFGFAITGILKGNAVADKLKEQMQY
ncbi:MAG: DJ-1/PfpI family protein [Clostridia bacterium]|nr:DJ-1/PfpI family protein [Clostridia bacterium]